MRCFREWSIKCRLTMLTMGMTSGDPDAVRKTLQTRDSESHVQEAHIFLPDGTFLPSLKAEPELSKIPVIMVSIIDDKDRGFTLGANEYLTRPIHPERRMRVLERFHTNGVPGKAPIDVARMALKATTSYSSLMSELVSIVESKDSALPHAGAAAAMESTTAQLVQ